MLANARQNSMVVQKIGSVILVTLVMIVTSSSLAKKEKNKVLQADSDIKQREFMVQVAKDLGVTCTYCHDVTNFRSDKLKAHQVAKEHMRVTKLINEEGFKGKPKVSCFVCHRGQTKVPSTTLKTSDNTH